MQPALFMPIGNRDWQSDDSCLKLDFLEVLLPKLASLGWTIGVDFKSDRISIGGWQGKCAERVLQKGGRLVWHPANFKIAFGIGKSGGLTDLLQRTGEDALFFKKEYPLEALVVHPDAVQYGEPAPDAGFERYNAKVTANKVLQAIKNHPRPLSELNALCGGILHIENVHNCLFSENQTNLPTYEAMQLGYLELPWIAKEAGIKTVMDSEHFFGARNFYERQKDFASLPYLDKKQLSRSKYAAQSRLEKIAGYLVIKGFPAMGTKSVTFQKYIDLLGPRLFHIGAAKCLVDEKGRVNSHLETDTSYPVQRQILLLELDYIIKNNCIGAEVEVVSNASWSPRSADDFVAKMRECLTIVDAIEKLQDGIWQLDSNIKI